MCMHADTKSHTQREHHFYTHSVMKHESPDVTLCGYEEALAVGAVAVFLAVGGDGLEQQRPAVSRVEQKQRSLSAADPRQSIGSLRAPAELSVFNTSTHSRPICQPAGPHTHTHTHTLQRLSSPVILIMLLLSKSCNK